MAKVTGSVEVSRIVTAANLEKVLYCLLCGETRRRVLFVEKPFTVQRCQGCGLVYTNPRLSVAALPRVYGERYWSSSSPSLLGYADYRGEARHYRKTFQERFRLVQQFLPNPGRVLDVGCAAGYFLQVMREAGWEAEGVDLSPEIVRYARERFGLQHVHTGTLEAVNLAATKYDLVTFWDVIEHVHDPLKLLRQAVGLVRDGGYIILETQNVESFLARLLGRRWHHFKHLEHLYHFSPTTIERLLHLAGLRVVALTPRHAGKFVSFDFVQERAGRLSPLFSRALQPFVTVFGSMHLYVNVMDEMIVVARTKEIANGDAMSRSMQESL